MKTLLALGSMSLSLLSTVAMAADLPSRRAPPVFVPPPVPVFTWTGAYVGATAGYAFNGNHSLLFNGTSAVSNADLGAGRRPINPGQFSSGFTGGGTIGYNFSTQSLPVLNGLAGGIAGGGVVFGVEADAAYTDLNNNAVYTGTSGLNSSISSRTQFVGTVRGRVGLAFDRVLVYGTGGFAYGGVRDNVVFAGANGFRASRNTIQTGYAYGGGVEYALPTASFLNFLNSSAVTIKAEYIHYNLGRENIGGTGAYNARALVAGDLVRAGLNFKFGAPAVPVVARY